MDGRVNYLSDMFQMRPNDNMGTLAAWYQLLAGDPMGPREHQSYRDATGQSINGPQPMQELPRANQGVVPIPPNLKQLRELMRKRDEQFRLEQELRRRNNIPNGAQPDPMMGAVRG